MSTPRTLFTREDLTSVLRELTTALDATGEEVRLRIVGGAAISFAYNADRGSTVDIDALLSPRNVVLGAAENIAALHGWVADWLNDAARIFIPEGFGQRAAEWVLMARVGKVEVYVASAETLLAMKLKAVIRRGLREVNDLRILLTVTGVDSVDEADALLDAFYPGDALTEKARQIVQIALDTRPSQHVAPQVPSLT